VVIRQTAVSGNAKRQAKQLDNDINIRNQMKESSEKAISDLATKLARNLFSISFKAGTEIRNAAKEILAFPEINFKPERFIVVVGAGSSKHANKNIPLGQEAIKKLKKDYNIESISENKTVFQEIEKLFQDEIEELSQVYRLEKDDFETVLLALSKYFPKDIYEKLANYYGYRYYPDGFYELLAHLFKNRFIDAIINFNFDELLDQAIEDEIGSSAYRKVLFDGDLPDYNNEVIKDDHFQQPFYVKPHGTFSHKTSMRFTRRDYFNISSDIDIFLGKLVSGQLSTKSGIKVNLLVFGFNMESFEFINLLKKNLPRNSTVYIFDKPHKGFYSKEIGDSRDSKVKTIYIPWNDEEYSIDKVLKRLFEEISNKFKDGYKPVSIERQLCISTLFKYEKVEKRKLEEDIAYFKDRVYIELAMQIAKSKGFISLQQLTNDRTGRYYNLYKKYLGKLDEKLTKEKTIPLYKFCENIGLEKYAYSREFYRLPENGAVSDEKVTVSESIFNKFLENLTRNLKQSGVTNELCQKIESENKVDEYSSNQNYSLKATLNELFRAEDSEYCQKDKDLHDNIFKDPIEIKTKLAFNYETVKMFKKPAIDSWDYFLSVAETGEWLWKKAEIKIEGKKIRLIVADKAFQAKLIEKFAHGIEEEVVKNELIKIEHLNWWRHNQHMSLFIKKDKRNRKRYSIVKVIYFTRKSRSNLITPVILLDDDDKKLALEIFIAYYIKTQKEKDVLESMQVNSESVEKIRKMYLDELLSEISK
jgi:hypothetical protein